MPKQDLGKVRSKSKELRAFQKTVWEYYRANRRPMPWRETTDPYAILVSEVMLQQTQVSRVREKFPVFISHFPTWDSLAAAAVAQVLQVWQGLGYSRRALNVHRLAQIVVRDYGGKLPEHVDELKKLPGIGTGTAGSIAAFAFNTPAVFIETNIRRVFLHHFFGDNDGVGDNELLPLVKAAVDRSTPREWYYALMDYGAYLAKTVTNPNRRSKHYAKQSKFEGSERQVRGEILRQLLAGPKALSELAEIDGRVPGLLPTLEKEGFIKQSNGTWMLA